MKILSRHLFSNLMQPLIYLLLAFTLLTIIGDLMDSAEDFLSSKVPPVTILKYYGLKLPSLIIFIVPLCLLLATLYSLSMLTRHSEIIAMRACGISIYRIVRPYMLLGFICFLLTALVNEFTGPKYAYRAEQLKNSATEKTEDAYFENIAYKNPTSGHEWHIVGFDTRTYTMKGITFNKFRPNGSNETKIKAEKGSWLDHRWWFTNATIQRYDENNTRLGNPEEFQTLEMRKLPEIPEDFMGEAKDPDFQSSFELWNYMKTHKHLSPETLNNHEVDLHHKLTMPF
ncbi:MAG: LptF/LptG family permease, partial [Kiritimatiellaceae bacterium]|nr:LptF/LptG family permease [Kiritimatiellaceae bacterium]